MVSLSEYSKIYDWAAAEIERQHANDDPSDMVDAFLFVQEMGVKEGTIHHAYWIMSGDLGYRRVPVYFANGTFAMNYMSVRAAMDSLFMHGMDLTPDEFTKEFLTVHPFVDYNGRVGSICWNVLSNNHIPHMMPDFF